MTAATAAAPAQSPAPPRLARFCCLLLPWDGDAYVHVRAVPRAVDVRELRLPALRNVL